MLDIYFVGCTNQCNNLLKRHHRIWVGVVLRLHCTTASTNHPDRKPVIRATVAVWDLQKRSKFTLTSSPMCPSHLQKQELVMLHDNVNAPRQKTN